MLRCSSRSFVVGTTNSSNCPTLFGQHLSLIEKHVVGGLTNNNKTFFSCLRRRRRRSTTTNTNNTICNTTRTHNERMIQPTRYFGPSSLSLASSYSLQRTFVSSTSSLLSSSSTSKSSTLTDTFISSSSREETKDESYGKKKSLNTSIKKKKLSPTELNQLYDLLHLNIFTQEEIANVADAIVMSTIGENKNGIDADFTLTAACLSDSTPDVTPEQDDLQHVTVDKLSNLLQSRIYQEMLKTNQQQDDKPKGNEEHINALLDSEDKKQQIIAYSKDLSYRFLTYHILPQVSMDQSVDQSVEKRTTESEEAFSSATSKPTVSKDEFIKILEVNVTLVDYGRVWPISLSMLLVGSSVGIIVPLMPFVAEKLSLTPGQYGVTVSAFALSKLFGNIPSAILCERHGRKPFLVYSLNLVALGVGGIGLATQVEHLVICRLLTGLGVAALSTGATLTIADLSTPRNRASTLAPMNSSFAAGMALGPAIGGMLGDYVGVDNTFLMVGTSYLGVVALNSYLLKETKRFDKHKHPWFNSSTASNHNSSNNNNNIYSSEMSTSTHTNTTKQQQQQPSSSSSSPPLSSSSSTTTTTNPSLRSSVQDAVGQWVPLFHNTKVRRTVILNIFYWCALSGAQMTLLPLMLTSPQGMGLSAGTLGQVYMGMSIVQVLGNPTVAKMVDHVGKVPSIVFGCTALSTAMFCMPQCDNLSELAFVLGIWTLGSTTLSTSPFAYLADAVPVEKRAQALALLRTGGDVGFLLGATSAGALADWTGDMNLAMQMSSGLLLTGTLWFASRQLSFPTTILGVSKHATGVTPKKQTFPTEQPASSTSMSSSSLTKR